MTKNESLRYHARKQPGAIGVAKCGLHTSNSEIREDLAAVTCKGCLRSLSREKRLAGTAARVEAARVEAARVEAARVEAARKPEDTSEIKVLDMSIAEWLKS